MASLLTVVFCYYEVIKDANHKTMRNQVGTKLKNHILSMIPCGNWPTGREIDKDAHCRKISCK